MKIVATNGRTSRLIDGYLLPSSNISRSIINEELGLLGDGFLGGFGDEGVDEDVDDLQGRIPEGHENQDLRTNESSISELESRWIERRVGNALGCDSVI